jgi:hypothetical protein
VAPSGWSLGFAERKGYPTHQRVVRPEPQDDSRVHKDTSDWTRLRVCFDQSLAHSSKGQVFAALDLRAFANPSRMQHIERASTDLLQRMPASCPACEGSMPFCVESAGLMSLKPG